VAEAGGRIVVRDAARFRVKFRAGRGDRGRDRVGGRGGNLKTASPQYPAVVERRPGPAERKTPKRFYTVLLVDDETDTLESLRQLFDREVDVHVAKSGREALAFLGRTPVDLMVVDYRMPGMNGLELLAEVEKRAPGIDCIMITGVPDPPVAARALNDGGLRRFLPKPVDPQELLRVVRELRAARR